MKHLPQTLSVLTVISHALSTPVAQTPTYASVTMPTAAAPAARSLQCYTSQRDEAANKMQITIQGDGWTEPPTANYIFDSFKGCFGSPLLTWYTGKPESVDTPMPSNWGISISANLMDPFPIACWDAVVAPWEEADKNFRVGHECPAAW